MYNWKYFLFFVFVILSITVKAQDSIVNNVNKVKIGAYFTSIHDFNLGNNTISADIHLWCIYNDESYDFENELELINCNEYQFFGTSIFEVENNKKWFYTKAIVNSRQIFSTENYPFDNQLLTFSIESSEHTIEEFIFEPDLIGSKLDPIVYKQFDDWNILDVNFTSSNRKYETSFGDPSETTSNYPSFDISILISRKSSWLIFIKLITGIIVAFLISVCVFWIKPINTDPRFGLSVGGLFAAIGNKYTVEIIVPSTNTLTLIDKLHNLTFIYIFIIIVVSVISLMLFEKDNSKYLKLSKRIDFFSFFLFTISYFLIFTHYLFKFL